MLAIQTPTGSNAARYTKGDASGLYESFFLRANHPTRPLAFWIRYTVFAPRGRVGDAVGERWAVYFDGERKRTWAGKDVVPLDACAFSKDALSVDLGQAHLDDKSLYGQVSGDDGDIRWELGYGGGGAPLLLLAPRRYQSGFPKAKALTPQPLARFAGTLHVAGQDIDVDDWVGSQNHNWGSRHTDQYAWGQVAGFDDAPDAFLELSTARVRVGPVWTPFISLAVLRHDGQEYRFDSLTRGAGADARFGYFDWHVAVGNGHARLSARLTAPREHFVALRYDNPPGGYKTCLNSKLAACAVALQRPGKPIVTLQTAHRAAFEILTDDHTGHGLPHRA